MNSAIQILRASVEQYKLYPNCIDLVKECEEAADLLEKLTTSAANQVAEAAPPSRLAHLQLAAYATRDAFLTMALFAGVPRHLVENLLGLISYIKEMEEKTVATKPDV